MKLYDIILDSAYEWLKKQNNDGSMPSWHNWPYYHPETNLRNTFHWSIIFLKAYKISNDEEFLEASKKIADFVFQNKPEFNFHHRTFENRDKCNWTIWPAWSIESLLFLSKELWKKDLEDLASKIFLNHKFDYNLWLWERREIDWRGIWIDWTFNHQLWFAVIWSMFDKKHIEIHKQVQRFIKMLNKNFDIYNNWLIWHPIAQITFDINWINKILHRILSKTKNNKKDTHKAIGYHTFNLYAFWILKENYPEIDFWISEKFKKSLNFLKTEKFEKWLENNKYWFDYNVVWIEAAYILQTFFPNSEEKQKYWLEKQFIRNYDFEKNLLSKNTKDSETLSARLYEATRLKNIDLDLDNFLNSEKPFVSVILPVYNDSERLKICLDLLSSQSYPKDKYEIIVIDNNSTDNIKDLHELFPNVIFLLEDKIQSSYAARNKWLKEAKWEIIAFIDSDCQPIKEWIENWVKWIIENNSDLLSWKVDFIFTDENNPYEIFDSINNIQQYEKFLRWEAATANLFSYKYVFDKVWLFPDNVKSGWDTTWTSRATKAKFNLYYSKNTIVNHPTRDKIELFEKNIRVGFWQIPIWKSKNKWLIFYIIKILVWFLPPIMIIKKLKFWLFNNIKVFLVWWLCKIYINIWRFRFLIKK